MRQIVQFAVEAWDPDYGTGGDVEALDASTDEVDAGVEVPVGQWAPVSPLAGPASGVVYFVDGVRRIDARIWVTDEGRVLPGSCATVAAGSVACTGTEAFVSEVEVRRAVFTPPAESAGAISTDVGEYHHVTVRSGSPEDLYLGIHEEMTALETMTVPTPGPTDLVVFDGPLRGRVVDRSIGLIKTQHVQYLELAEQQIVASLDAGQRSPLFMIGAGRFARWSWYLRLPGPRTHGWAGVVRCEMAASERTGSVEEDSLSGPAGSPGNSTGSVETDSLSGPTGSPGNSTGSVEKVTALADQVSATLPRFASEPHKENRAPQNLYPIKGLEQALRRRLGDQRLVQRALRRASQISL